MPFGIAKYSADRDRDRALCSAGDCLILAFGVAGVRVFAVNKEEEALALEHEEKMRRAAEEEQKKPDPNRPARHLTPSLLRGGAPSPRLPTSPKK